MLKKYYLTAGQGLYAWTEEDKFHNGNGGEIDIAVMFDTEEEAKTYLMANLDYLKEKAECLGKISVNEIEIED